ncbi:hypothetical protein [Rhodococcus sp. IEGM 1379]|uniref:hypothetical protein n=1 Tax=Rhodococcus sp. IEGM 1379 TaxID=3047086 RepID=UPI0024B68529|nr:hypothetical protein [Rhodococcus sp. IEGM 1379]MDI9918944.1 hypothetical protein [Rhodococcus sp. IEGM 1379]
MSPPRGHPCDYISPAVTVTAGLEQKRANVDTAALRRRLSSGNEANGSTTAFSAITTPRQRSPAVIRGAP